ncbi:MAG: FliH/SctL family protein [Syntrophorhabdaceae bacterium]|nr:FliH/SctL family protein [Syntrophorhabdaceae bacterium]
MNSSSKIEPLILRSIDEIEEDQPTENRAFISFFQERIHDNQIESNIDNELKEHKKEVDIEAQVRKIFEDAYREGERAGFEMGMKKAEPIIKRLNRDLASIESFKEEMLRRVEEMAIELSLYFTEILVLKECTKHRETLVDMIKRALEICEDRTDIKIRMRSDDIKYISEENIKTLNIVPDDTIDEPGFIIETNFGEIDGRISSQMDELKKYFFEKGKCE